MKNPKPTKMQACLVATLFALSWSVLLLPVAEASPPPILTPACSVSWSGGWCRSPVTITIDCPANPPYTFLSLSYQIDGGPFTTKTVNTTSLTDGEEGEHTVHAICHDSSLLDSDAIDSYRIDLTAPTVSATMPFLIVGGGRFDVFITVADAGSGLTGTLKVEEAVGTLAVLSTLVGGDGTWSTVSEKSVSGPSASVTVTRMSPGEEAYCYRVTVSDVAGNALDGAAAMARGDFPAGPSYSCVNYRER